MTLALTEWADGGIDGEGIHDDWEKIRAILNGEPRILHESCRLTIQAAGTVMTTLTHYAPKPYSSTYYNGYAGKWAPVEVGVSTNWNSSTKVFTAPATADYIITLPALLLPDLSTDMDPECSGVFLKFSGNIYKRIAAHQNMTKIGGNDPEYSPISAVSAIVSMAKDVTFEFHTLIMGSSLMVNVATLSNPRVHKRASAVTSIQTLTPSFNEILIHRLVA